MFIIARVSDKEIIKVSGTYAPGQTPSKEVMLPKIVKEFGGEIKDYEYLFIEDKSVEAVRISEQDSFELSWKKEPIDEKNPEVTKDVIEDVDFTPEDSKLIVKVESDKTIVNTNDEADKATIIISILNPDKTISSFAEGMDLSIMTPDRRMVFIRVIFEKGKATISFKPVMFGKWIFPCNSKRFENFIIENQVEIHARMPI